MSSAVKAIVLASQSPHRQRLLERMGLAIQSQAASGIQEDAIKADTPSALALARARGKALDVASRQKDAVVIGCDQVLDLDGFAMGKAATVAEARARLTSLAGKTHFLRNGLCLLWTDGSQVLELYAGVPAVAMTMRPLTAEDIEAYLATEEWRGCAGCYRVEGQGMLLFDQVLGSEADIIGLPVLTVFQQLQKHGLDLLLRPRGPWSLQL